MTDRYELEIHGLNDVVFKATFNLGEGYMAGFNTCPIEYVTAFSITPLKKEEPDND